MLPVEAQMTVVAPRPSASLTAAVMPRSLKEPVGFSPSYLMNNSNPPPSWRHRPSALIKGVLPSSRLMTLVSV